MRALALILVLLCPSVSLAGGFYDMIRKGIFLDVAPGPSGAATGDIDTAGYGVCAYAPTTDVAPNDLAIHSAACYAQGTQTSSNLILAGGLAPKTITVVTPADTVGDTVAATVNSVILAALTEGVDWDCAALTTAQCATNLAAAITGQTGSGAVCVGVAAVVYCQPVDCDTWGLSYTLSDNVAMTYSGGTNGAILIYGDGAGVPDLGFAEDPDTGFRWQSSGVFNLMSNGANQLQITTATINFWDNYAYSSAGMFKLGGPMTTSHALGVGAVGVANELEVDGMLFADGGITFGAYTRHHDMSIGAAVLGPDAPALASIGTFRCASMLTAAKTLTFNQETPPEWEGASDMELHLLAFTETGDALGNGEVIEFDAVYRSIDVVGNEAYDNGTAVTINLAETGGASEVEKGGYLLTATMPYTGGNQPLAVGDEVGLTVNRDVDDTDTYSGTVYICKAQIVYTATGKATH